MAIIGGSGADNYNFFLAVLIVRRSFIPFGIAVLLLGACSPAQYKVDLPVPEKAKESIPESQKEGYMRIVGDLRWDELTSKEEWMKRFPDCFRVGGWNDQNTTGFIEPTQSADCKETLIAGIPIRVVQVWFRSSSGTDSNFRTSSVRFAFANSSQSRAFKAALHKKYAGSPFKHCSRFTCWKLGSVEDDGDAIAVPTPNAVLLLDQVRIKLSDL